jgi:hypothetical protein
MWVYVMEAVSEVLIDGLARVKRCSQEGRAQMSLDAQSLAQAAQKLRPDKGRVAMPLVEGFVKVEMLKRTPLPYPFSLFALSWQFHSRGAFKKSSV